MAIWVCGEHRMKVHLLVAETWILVVRTETGQFSATIVFVVYVVCDILQVLQMCANDHITQSDEITMLQIFDCERKPKTERLMIVHSLNIRQHYLRQHPTDNVGHALCGHQFRPQHWRRRLRMAHDFWVDAMFSPPLRLQVVPENRRF